jgi:acetyl esterase
MSDLFPPDAPRPQPSEFFDIAVAMLDNDPHALDEAMRTMVPSTAQLVEKFPEFSVVEMHDITVNGPHGPVPARSYLAPGKPATDAVVWVHGGAFVFGDLDMLESHWVALSLAERGVPVLAVDYRKAVAGTHFPVPSDDVLAAWEWAVAHCDTVLGVRAARLHFGGGSAGANLAAGVAKRLRDTGGALPASLLLAYGVFHATLPPFSDELQAALTRHPNPMIFTADDGNKINIRYAGDEATLSNPYAFPGNGAVTGLPPIYLLNSDADNLRSSAEQFGRQLAAAGVPVLVELEPDTTHGHLNEADDSAVRSIDRMVAWLTSAHT